MKAMIPDKLREAGPFLVPLTTLSMRLVGLVLGTRTWFIWVFTQTHTQISRIQNYVTKYYFSVSKIISLEKKRKPGRETRSSRFLVFSYRPTGLECGVFGNDSVEFAGESERMCVEGESFFFCNVELKRCVCCTFLLCIRDDGEYVNLNLNH